MSAVSSHFGGASCSHGARVYRPRRPERTALYRLVQQHLAPWLAVRRDADPDGCPVAIHVERELRAYLECGILACGFARALRCTEMAVWIFYPLATATPCTRRTFSERRGNG